MTVLKAHIRLIVAVLVALWATPLAAQDPRAPELLNAEEVTALIMGTNAGRLISNGVTASAEVMVSIDALGRVTDYRLVRPTGARIIDAALAQATRRMQFAPARREGQPVASSAMIPFEFGERQVRTPAATARRATGSGSPSL